MSNRWLTFAAEPRPPVQRPPRLLVAGLLACCALSLSGCQIFTRFRNEPLKVPAVLDKSASLDQLMAAVRSQSERVNQIKTDVRVTAPGSPTLRGDLQIERPDRLRLQAGVLGILGPWLRPRQQPGQFLGLEKGGLAWRSPHLVLCQP